jgi:hypothetical protein
MTDLVVLVCAAAGSMGFGILAAYGVLRVGFALIRPRTRRLPMKPQTEAARLL